MRYALAAMIWTVLPYAACGPAAPARLLNLPERADEAPGGDEIYREILTLELGAREERIYDEIARGNVPNWLRRLKPVELSGEVDGRDHRVTFWVTPDYLAVGSDSDNLLIPLINHNSRSKLIIGILAECEKTLYY